MSSIDWFHITFIAVKVQCLYLASMSKIYLNENTLFSYTVKNAVVEAFLTIISDTTTFNS